MTYNSSGHVSRVARRRVDSFLRIFHRDRNCERPDQKTRGERSEREKETGPGGCARGERMRERREKGRSVGRSEVPFCFSASVWRRDSSGTLSERDVITTPLLLPSQGVPRTLHLLPTPRCRPQSPFPTPDSGLGYNVDQARGCLTGCRAFSVLSFFLRIRLVSSRALTGFKASTLNEREKEREREHVRR